MPLGPPDPLNSNGATFTPDLDKQLLLNGGDNVTVDLHDTAQGLQVVIDDLSAGQSGSMTASAANGFGEIQYTPTGTSCTVIPSDFHPVYSTSSENTRVVWAAHSYNVARKRSGTGSTATRSTSAPFRSPARAPASAIPAAPISTTSSARRRRCRCSSR